MKIFKFWKVDCWWNYFKSVYSKLCSVLYIFKETIVVWGWGPCFGVVGSVCGVVFFLNQYVYIFSLTNVNPNKNAIMITNKRSFIVALLTHGLCEGDSGLQSSGIVSPGVVVTFF